jgi:hypothetical protein
MVLGPEWLAVTLLLIAQGEKTPDAAAPTGTELIRSTQITVIVEDGRKLTKFQATVLARSHEHLTILTGAHCLANTEDGLPLVITQPRASVALRGKVARVWRNPHYQPGANGPTSGADNALAILDVAPANDKQRQFLDALTLANLVEWPALSRDGQVLDVTVHDQKGVEHVVRASNYSNPRWLEWGPAYQPIPGDSGSGLFVVLRDSKGVDHVILVGSLVDRSREGGGGSLVCKRYPWVAQALAPPFSNSPAANPPAVLSEP